ncbi:hypothetical protein [Spiroplasma culicicola]|uniref:Nucleotidyltransferase n=1 Tax=Spiroplasma culicicola AES-1 TaxID=1276246 RepID=W6A7W1_9MOLU|nr:hypothetical protein [Spiroplasma culicicola]AHI53082.1 hypothetical protein SCULI_v1c07410 [Spiroplasma culicicola AES-1]
MQDLKALKQLINSNENKRNKRFDETISILDKFVKEKSRFFLNWDNNKPYLIRGSFAHDLDSDFTTNIDIWILLKKVSKPDDVEHNMFIFKWFEKTIKEYFKNYSVSSYQDKSSIEVAIEQHFTMSFMPFVLDHKGNFRRMFKLKGKLFLDEETNIKSEPEFNLKLKKVGSRSSIANIKIIIISLKIIIQNKCPHISGDIIENFVLDQYLAQNKVNHSQAFKTIIYKMANGEFEKYIEDKYKTWLKLEKYETEFKEFRALAKEIEQKIELKNSMNYVDVLLEYIKKVKA